MQRCIVGNNQNGPKLEIWIVSQDENEKEARKIYVEAFRLFFDVLPAKQGRPNFLSRDLLRTQFSPRRHQSWVDFFLNLTCNNPRLLPPFHLRSR